MSKITDDVKAEITNGYMSLCESFGINPTVGRIYTVIFFSDKALGLDEIAAETGYSVSTISKSMNISENIFDIRRFRNPGSKKVYFECEHSAIAAIRKAFFEVLGKNIEDMARIIDGCEIKLREDESEKSRAYLRNVQKLKKDYEAINRLLELMSGPYKFDESKIVKDQENGTQN